MVATTTATVTPGEQPLTTTAGILPHSDTLVPVGQATTSLGGGSTSVPSGFEGAVSHLSEGQVVFGGAGAGVTVGNDQQILKQHELALQRLEELQGDMIGGEKGGKLYG